MPSVGERIAQRRIALGMTQGDLADAVGMKQQGIDSIEKGKSQRPKKLREIAVELRTSQEYLLGETDDADLPRGQGRRATVSSATGRRGLPADSIPEADPRSGLGGGGLPAQLFSERKGGESYSAEEVHDHWRLPDWVHRSVFYARPNQLVCFRTLGDSMQPTIMNGDVIFADLHHKVPSPDGIYVLADEYGGIIVKRLQVLGRQGDGPARIRVLSDNPNHEAETKMEDDIHIIGRYVGRFTPF